MSLPDSEMMRALSKIAIEKATYLLAAMADEFAANLPEGISGPDALRAFASSIRQTNAEIFLTAGKS